MEGAAVKEMDVQSLKWITGYVNDQKELPDLQLGSKGNLPKHGCGVVAVHNAIVLMGKESNLYDVYKYFNNNSKLIIRTFVNPFSIIKYLKKQGFKISINWFNNNVLNSDACIAIYKWKANGKWDLHYQTIAKVNSGDANTYIAFNKTGAYTNRQDFINDNSITQMYAILGINRGA